jgi:hypothetical protein
MRLTDSGEVEVIVDQNKIGQINLYRSGIPNFREYVPVTGFLYEA